MDTDHVPRLSAYDSDPCIEEILELCEPYIRSLALKKVPRNVCHRDTVDLDVDELVQITRIKLWQILLKQEVAYPVGYARRIIFSEVVNMVRRHDYCFPLQASEDGEIVEGRTSRGEREEQQNPAEIFDVEERQKDMLAEVVGVIANMSLRQQQASVCRLKEKVDNLTQLVDALRSRNIDSEVEYPEDSYERQKLQSSYTPAKRKLAQRLGVDLALYK